MASLHKTIRKSRFLGGSGQWPAEPFGKLWLEDSGMNLNLKTNDFVLPVMTVWYLCASKWCCIRGKVALRRRGGLMVAHRTAMQQPGFESDPSPGHGKLCCQRGGRSEGAKNYVKNPKNIWKRLLWKLHKIIWMIDRWGGCPRDSVRNCPQLQNFKEK
jgi:hypothetical protein